MKVVNVDGMPLRRLKEQHAVIIIQALPEFKQLATNSTVFVDEQKMYFLQGQEYLVYFFKAGEFSGGNLNECSRKYKQVSE